jgi:hypothetical protein
MFQLESKVQNAPRARRIFARSRPEFVLVTCRVGEYFHRSPRPCMGLKIARESLAATEEKQKECKKLLQSAGGFLYTKPERASEMGREGRSSGRRRKRKAYVGKRKR